ncbi:MAG: Gar1/Naf1 family protein [Methanoregulaceae archaeon]
MKLIGRVEVRYGSRMLILRCDPAQLPRLYAETVDRKMKPVGKILDVFGNIKCPYASILCRKPCDIQPGDKIYAK